MLCQRCALMFTGELGHWNRQDHHKTIKDLGKASRDGCYICRGIWEHLLRKNTPHRDASEQLITEEAERVLIDRFTKGTAQTARETMNQFLRWFSVQTASETGNNFLSWCFDPGFENGGKVVRLTSKTDGHYDVYHPIICTPMTKPDTENLALLRAGPGFQDNVIRHWLKECTASHQNCIPRSSDWLPTRLLCLKEGKTFKVRLIDTIDLSVPKPYVTLSHCWGKAEFLKHTAETAHDLYAGIVISLLPKTFQDAIKIALLLGVEYLWIDSLCIVQDDKEDWVQESAVMGRVYENGLCNIAATRATSAGDGFLAEHPSALPIPYVVLSTWTDTENYYWQIDHEHNLEKRCVGGPLFSRGWVVQERYMSPRTLHFCEDELYWECHQLHACESYPSGQSQVFGSRSLKDKQPVLGSLVRVRDETFKAFEALAKWRAVVVEFSRCELTMELDKLPAVSGVAKEMQRVLRNSNYIAGMWRDSLETELLWHVDGDATRPGAYTAPTWSWASVNGVVKFCGREVRDFTEKPFINILEAVAKPNGSDPTGQVLSGFLRLRGPLFTVSLPLAKNVFGSNIHTLTFGTVGGNVHRPIWIDLPAEEIPSNCVHCLPVQMIEGRYGTVHNPHVQFGCLLLRPASRERRERFGDGEQLPDKGIFTRIGMGLLHCGGPMSVIEGYYGFSIRNEVPRWSEIKNDDWFEYQEDHGDGTYTITIL